jgi:hypothetical protein
MSLKHSTHVFRMCDLSSRSRVYEKSLYVLDASIAAAEPVHCDLSLEMIRTQSQQEYRIFEDEGMVETYRS